MPWDQFVTIVGQVVIVVLLVGFAFAVTGEMRRTRRNKEAQRAAAVFEERRERAYLEREPDPDDPDLIALKAAMYLPREKWEALGYTDADFTRAGLRAYGMTPEDRQM